MKSILEKFQFHIQHPSAGEIRVWPNNNELEFQYRREEKQIFFRKHLETELNFVDDSIRNITDFTTLYQLDRSKDRCSKIPLTIRQFPCSGIEADPWPVVWTGYIALVDASIFDVDRCIIRVKPRIEDQYECLFENWEEEINVLEVPAVETGDHWGVETIALTQDYRHIVNLENPEFPPPGSGDPIFDKGYVDFPLFNPHLWTPIDNKIRFYELTSPADPSKPWTFEITTILQSWVAVTECNNGNPVSPGYDFELIEACEQTVETEEGFAKFRQPIASTVTIPPRGRKMEDVIEKLLEPCGLKLESYIFGAGGVGNKPDNDVYNWADNNLEYLTLHQITDIKTKDPDEYATRAELTLKDFLEDLAELNVLWMVDENDNFILEHISYFILENRMLDLSSEATKAYIQGRHNYKYAQERLPAREVYSWYLEAERNYKRNIRSTGFIPGQGRVGTTLTATYNQLSFDAGIIQYSEVCGNTEANTEYQFKSFVTNIADILENPDAYPDNLLVLIASNGQWEHIVQETFPGNIPIPGQFQARTRVNAPLTLVELIARLIRYRRPHAKGLLKDVGIEISTTQPKRLREQDEISIPICCEELINTFDPADLVKTQLGWGEVREATLLEPHSELRLNLLFR